MRAATADPTPSRVENTPPAFAPGGVFSTLDLMIVAFSIAPAGPDDTGSYAAAVAEAVRIVRASGLPNETNAMFTNIEGDWDEVWRWSSRP